MVPEAFSDKVIPVIYITDEAVVRCYVPQVKILLQMKVFFFLAGFSFTTIHKSQDCRGRERPFL